MHQTKQRGLVKDLSCKKQSRSHKIKLEQEKKKCIGIDYPLDLWFIISEYIKPEAIGKFACICRSSYYVTTTAKFWFHLYKTYYRFVPNMPQRLQPHMMLQHHGLRACVIRTLHHTYFAERNTSNYVSRLQQEQPHSLVKGLCSLMWHKKGTNWCYFFFTLKKVSKTCCNGTTTQRRRQDKYMCEETEDIETIVEDINANPEDGCKLLKVRCLKYSKLPLVIGLILQKVSVTLMPRLNYLRLQLGFGTSDLPNTVTNQVILNDVTDYEILDWWHPRYPHQDTMSTLVHLTADDSWD